MNKQPEALRLADACDTLGNLLLLVPGLDTFKCAAELRRQHALILEMRDALRGMVVFFNMPGEQSTERYERMSAMFHKDTGYVAPGKDCRLYDPAVRLTAFEAWIEARESAVRTALRKAEEQS